MEYHVNTMNMIMNHSVPWWYYRLIPLMYHDITTGRSQCEVFILKINYSVVEIIAETIFHIMFSMSLNLFALDKGVLLKNVGM